MAVPADRLQSPTTENGAAIQATASARAKGIDRLLPATIAGCRKPMVAPSYARSLDRFKILILYQHVA
jgi:hypothetical protein